MNTELINGIIIINSWWKNILKINFTIDVSSVSMSAHSCLLFIYLNTLLFYFYSWSIFPSFLMNFLYYLYLLSPRFCPSLFINSFVHSSPFSLTFQLLWFSSTKFPSLCIVCVVPVKQCELRLHSWLSDWWPPITQYRSKEVCHSSNGRLRYN